MISIQLIRHAKTIGNEQKKYIGVTDEGLSQNGKDELARLIRRGTYQPAEAVFTSPMRRCTQTAELIFGNTPREAVPEFAEYDFGEFEGKCYEELAENLCYRNWIASGWRSGIPEGEDVERFKTRSCEGFEKVISEILVGGFRTAAIVLHGGPIMAIMGRYSPGRQDFYEWHVPNCGGVIISIDEKTWMENCIIKQIDKLILPNISKPY